MKKTKALVVLTIAVSLWLLGSTCTVHAQTTNTTPINLTTNATIQGGLQELYDAALGSTNYAVAFGAGRGLTGNKNIAFADYLYNMNANAALMIGFDYLKCNQANTPSSTANIVKGGLQLNADIYPLKNYGFPTFKVTPFAGYCVASPTAGQNNGGVGAIAFTGIDMHTVIGKGWDFHYGAMYENRTGQGIFDGNYILLELAFSRNW